VNGRRGYNAKEYIATLVMCLGLTLTVITGVASPWLLLPVVVIAGLSTHLRVLRVRDMRALNDGGGPR